MNSDDDEDQDAEEDQVESQVDPQELGIPGEGSEEEGDEEREEGDPVVDSDREDPNKNPDQATTLEVEYEEYDSYWRVEKAEMELAAAREEMELAAAREEMELAAAREEMELAAAREEREKEDLECDEEGKEEGEEEDKVEDIEVDEDKLEGEEAGKGEVATTKGKEMGTGLKMKSMGGRPV